MGINREASGPQRKLHEDGPLSARRMAVTQANEKLTNVARLKRGASRGLVKAVKIQ